MHRLSLLSVLAAGVLLAPAAYNQSTVSPDKPTGATGRCRDGSYSTSSDKAAACANHKGVKEWYLGASGPEPATAPPSASSTPTATSSTTQARVQQQTAAQDAGDKNATAASSTAAAAATQAAAAPTPATTAPAPASTEAKGPRGRLADTPVAPGGGPGLVWLNSSSNVYHCPGSDFYGRTKAGSYMTEAEARAKGAHGVRGKSCSK